MRYLVASLKKFSVLCFLLWSIYLYIYGAKGGYGADPKLLLIAAYEKDCLTGGCSGLERKNVAVQQVTEVHNSVHDLQDENQDNDVSVGVSYSKRAVQSSRLQRLSRACTKAKMPADLPRVYTKLYLVPEYNFTWCPVPKAASTTIRTSLAALVNSSSAAGPQIRQYFRLSKRQLPQLPSFVRSSFLFLVVRHPLDRILSTYRDKILTTSNARWNKIRADIIKIQESRTRLSALDKSKRAKTASDDSRGLHELLQDLFLGEDASRRVSSSYSSSSPSEGSGRNTTYAQALTGVPNFTEFLIYLVETLQYDRVRHTKGLTPTLDKHMAPYWSLCAPCDLPYDFIVKVETMKEDLEFLGKELGLQEKLINTPTHVSSETVDGFRNHDEAVQSYYSEVPYPLLEELVYQLREDFDLFGYSPQKHFSLAAAATKGSSSSDMS